MFLGMREAMHLFVKKDVTHLSHFSMVSTNCIDTPTYD